MLICATQVPSVFDCIDIIFFFQTFAKTIISLHKFRFIKSLLLRLYNQIYISSMSVRMLSSELVQMFLLSLKE